DATFVMTLNAATPARIDLVVEAHATAADIDQRILIYHWPSQSWRLLDERVAARQDEGITIANLANPADYIDPLTRHVQVRLVQWMPDASAARDLPARSHPAPHRPAFRTCIDQVRLLVTYP